MAYAFIITRDCLDNRDVEVIGPRAAREDLIEQRNDVTGQLKRTLELSAALCVQIAFWNGSLTAGEVRAALEQGKRIDANFSYFQRGKNQS